MLHYFIHDSMLYRSYLPGHLEKQSMLRDQFVVSQALIKLVLRACHDHAHSGSNLNFIPALDQIRDRY